MLIQVELSKPQAQVPVRAVSWVLANITIEFPVASEDVIQTHDTDVHTMVCPELWANYYMFFYTSCQDLSGESWQCVNAIHDEVVGLTDCEQYSYAMVARIVVLPSNCYCRVFSAIS